MYSSLQITTTCTAFFFKCTITIHIKFSAEVSPVVSKAVDGWRTNGESTGIILRYRKRPSFTFWRSPLPSFTRYDNTLLVRTTVTWADEAKYNLVTFQLCREPDPVRILCVHLLHSFQSEYFSKWNNEVVFCILYDVATYFEFSNLFRITVW